MSVSCLTSLKCKIFRIALFHPKLNRKKFIYRIKLKGTGWIRINCYSRYLSIFIFAANTIFIFLKNFCFDKMSEILGSLCQSENSLLPRFFHSSLSLPLSLSRYSFSLCVMFSMCWHFSRRWKKIIIFCRLCAENPIICFIYDLLKSSVCTSLLIYIT